MRTNYFYSLLFALLTSASISVIAAPASKQETASTVPAVTAVAAPQTAMVDINRADAATLQRELLGVGEVKAKAIVAYREANGAFSSVDCGFHAIRPPSPPTSGHLFHGHPARQSERSDAGLHC